MSQQIMDSIDISTFMVAQPGCTDNLAAGNGPSEVRKGDARHCYGRFVILNYYH